MNPDDTDDTSMAAASEQAADLAALQAQAGGAPAPAGRELPEPQEEGQQGPKQPSAQALQLAAMAVGILRPLICYAIPSLRTAPAELWEPVPMGVAGVLDHYDISTKVDNPWVGLALCCTPLAGFAAMEAMKESESKPKEPAGAVELSAPIPEAAPGSKTVTIGAAVVEAVT